MGQSKEAIEYMNIATKKCKRSNTNRYIRATPKHAKARHGIRCLTMDQILEWTPDERKKLKAEGRVKDGSRER